MLNHRLSFLFTVGYPSPASWIAENIKKAQDYLVNETRLGIPAIVQSEGLCILNLDKSIIALNADRVT